MVVVDHRLYGSQVRQRSAVESPTRPRADLPFLSFSQVRVYSFSPRSSSDLG